MEKKISSILKKKNDDVDIILEDGEILHIDIDIFTDYFLYEGKIIPLNEYNEIKDKIQIIDLKKYVLCILNKKNYSSLQIKKKLENKGVDKEKIEYLISYFKSLNYLNDEEYFKDLLYSLENKNFGYYRIKNNLDECFEQYTYLYDEDNELNKANRLLPDLIKKYSSYSFNKMKDSIFNSLKYQGFKDDIILKVLNNIQNEDNDYEKLKKDYIKLTFNLSKEDILMKKEKIISKLKQRGYNYKDINKLLQEEEL